MGLRLKPDLEMFVAEMRRLGVKTLQRDSAGEIQSVELFEQEPAPRTVEELLEERPTDRPRPDWNAGYQRAVSAFGGHLPKKDDDES